MNIKIYNGLPKNAFLPENFLKYLLFLSYKAKINGSSLVFEGVDRCECSVADSNFQRYHVEPLGLTLLYNYKEKPFPQVVLSGFGKEEKISELEMIISENINSFESYLGCKDKNKNKNNKRDELRMYADG